jgi:hypothetical protein
MSEVREEPRPKLEQARKPIDNNQDRSNWPTGKKTAIGAVVLAGTIATAGLVSDRLEKDEAFRNPENYHTLISSEKNTKIDGSKFLFKGDQLTIRDSSFVPTDPGKDNKINSNEIDSINGEKWDGRSNFLIENVPYVLDEDPTHRQGEAPWLVIEIKTKNGSQDLGYISYSGATKDIVEAVTRGEIAEVTIDNENNLKAVYDSGKTISEGDIGKTEIINPNPQKS